MVNALKSSTPENPLSLKAVAYNKENGEAVDMQNIKPEDGTPTEITVGISRSAEQIEDGVKSSELLASHTDLEKLVENGEYREKIIETLQQAKGEVINAGYFAKQLSRPNFDPTDVDFGSQRKLLDTINRSLAITAIPVAVENKIPEWTNGVTKNQIINDRNKPEERYTLKLSPEQLAAMKIETAGNAKIFDTIKDNATAQQDSYTITLDQKDYNKVTEALASTPYPSVEGEKITLNPNSPEFAGAQVSVRQINEAGQSVVVGSRATVNTALLPEEVRLQLTQQYAMNNDFGTHFLDPRRANYDTLRALRAGGSVDASIIQSLVAQVNTRVAA